MAAQLEYHSPYPLSGNVTLLAYPPPPSRTMMTTGDLSVTAAAAADTNKLTVFGQDIDHSLTTTVIATPPPSAPSASSPKSFSLFAGPLSSLITTTSHGTTTEVAQLPTTATLSPTESDSAWPHLGTEDTAKPAVGDFKPGGDQFWCIIGILVVGVIVLAACVVSLSICRRRQRRRDRDVRDLAEIDGEEADGSDGSDGSSVQEILQPHHDSTQGRHTLFLARLFAGVKRGLARRFDDGEELDGDEEGTLSQEKGRRCRSCGKLLGNEERCVTGTPSMTPEVEDSVAWQRDVCLDCAVRGSGITNRLRCGN